MFELLKKLESQVAQLSQIYSGSEMVNSELWSHFNLTLTELQRECPKTLDEMLEDCKIDYKKIDVKGRGTISISDKLLGKRPFCFSHSRLNTPEIINLTKYHTYHEVASRIDEIFDSYRRSKAKNVVFLFTMDDALGGNNYEIYISSDAKNLETIIGSRYDFEWCQAESFYLFECDSYEDAYKTALSMKETSPLCYEPDNNKPQP